MNCFWPAARHHAGGLQKAQAPETFNIIKCSTPRSNFLKLPQALRSFAAMMMIPRITHPPNDVKSRCYRKSYPSKILALITSRLVKKGVTDRIEKVRVCRGIKMSIALTTFHFFGWKAVIARTEDRAFS